MTLLLAACSSEPAPIPGQSTLALPSEPAVVFLVRHAEKLSSSVDSPLTEEGTERAGLLADMLRDVDLTAVHSTSTARTLATAEPTALSHGLTVAPYSDEALLVEGILAERGAHLVVGHSDTLPLLVSLLDPSALVPAIAGDEYDRLYVITQTDAGASTSLLRYGATQAR